MSRPRELLTRAVASLASTDPGNGRLLFAGRAVTGLVLSLAAAAVVATLTGQQFTGALLAAVVGMSCCISVNESTRTRQALVTAVMVVPCAVTLTLGSVLSPYPFAEDVAFVVVLFAAAYLRRYGSWGEASGGVAFPTYFFAVFLKATFDVLPWLLGAAAIGVAVSILVRVVVLPDRPDATLRVSMRSLYARLSAVVDDVDRLVVAGRLEDRAGRRLDDRLSRLGQTAVMIADQLEDDGVGAVPTGVDRDELAIRVLDSQLAAERLVGAVRHAITKDALLAEARPRLSAELDALGGALRAGPRGTSLRSSFAESEGTRDGGPAELWMVDAAVHRLIIAVNRAEAAAIAPFDGVEDADVAEESPTTDEATDQATAGDDDAETGLKRPTTRQAIQVGVAASLAIVAGELISPDRWYWAVIAAFVSFLGTTTRGQVLSKAWQRVLGTVAGVLGGVVVAAVVGQHRAVAMVLIFLCVFCAFYLLKVAYGLMAFWITVTLALLYDLLGKFSVGLLELRILETAVGAAIGVLVGYLVLPTSTREAVADDVGEFLDELRDTVAESAAVLTSRADVTELADSTHQLTSAWQTLQNSAKPLSRGIHGLWSRARANLRTTLLVLGACDHFGRRLVAHSRAATADPVRAGTVIPAADAVAANIVAIRDRLTGEDEPAPMRSAESLLDAAEAALGAESAPEYDEQAAGAIRALRRIDQSLFGLAGDLHLPVGADPHRDAS